MSAGDLILSLTPPAVLVSIGAILLWRKLYHEFPFFLTYLLYAAAAGVLRITVVHNPFLYFWFYWISEGIYGVLALAVLREVFRRIFALTYEAYGWFRLLFPATILLISILSAWQTFFHPLGRGISRIVNAIYWFDLGVHLFEGVILLLVLGLTAVFPVSWRRYEFGILAGFGINASITMLAYLLRFERGSSYEIFFRYGPPIAYVLAALIWLHAFLRPPGSLPKPQIDHGEMLEVIRRSRELLEKIERALGLRHRLALPPI